MNPIGRTWQSILALTAVMASGCAAIDDAPQRCAPAVVHLVRHAEKAPETGDPDVPLSAAGLARAASLAQRYARVPLAAIYATHLRRTQQTVASLAARRDLEIRVLPAADTARLVERLLHRHCGQTVLAAGHSNTVPDIVRGLGIAATPAIADDDYGVVYTVEFGPGGPTLATSSF